MAFTDGQPTPERFRLWAGIGAIAAALERRCWTMTAGRRTYPNLYTLLVGPPTSGKTVSIDITYDLWVDSKAFHIAPKSITSAGMVDALREADKKFMIPGNIMEYHSLIIPCPEFGTFINQHDLEMLANLNDIYDSPRIYGQKRRHVNGGKTIEILNPQINILGGAQPGFLASLLPEEAWSMGFTSRLIMVYGQESPRVTLFGTLQFDQNIRKELLHQMSAMTKVHGQFKWEESAGAEIERWYGTRMEPIPTHSKLEHYNGRRILHLLKLCMVASVSRGSNLSGDDLGSNPPPNGLELIIRLEDVNRARDWLLEAERFMPDIFRDMVLKSDYQTIQELHFHVWQIYSGTKAPVHDEHLYSFLSNRVPSEKITKIIETAERSGIINRIAGESRLYIPKPLTTYGIE